MSRAIDPISNAAIRSSLADSIKTIFCAWSRMSPEEWAEEVFRVKTDAGSIRFSWSYAPYSREMFLSMFRRDVIETIYQCYSRGLKSTMVLIAIGYIMDQMPRRMLSLWPTNLQAEKWSKDILVGELLDIVPRLMRYGSAHKKRDGNSTLLHKTGPGWLIDMFGANAPGDMRRAKGSFLSADEIDAIAKCETDEGDQLLIFSKRGDEYADTIRVYSSYPSLCLLDDHGNPLPGHSRIDAKLRSSDWNEWYSTCVVCGGEPFVMHRRMIRYEKDKPELARMECPRCGALLTDAQRHAMAHGQGFNNWRARNPFRGRRGFHTNAMLWPHATDPIKTPGGALQLIAQQELAVEQADDRSRALRVLVNTVDAEPYRSTDETEDPPPWRTIYDRRESYAEVPEGGLFLAAFVDVQKNRLELGWRAFGENEESWGLDYTVLDGYTKHPEVWRELSRELQRAFPHASGAQLRLSFCFIDGGAYSEEVLRFFQTLAKHPVEGVTGKVRASKGFGAFGHPVVTRGDMKSIAKNALKGHHIGTWQAKDLIYDRLRQTPNEDGTFPRGYMHYNQNYPEEYFIGLTKERAERVIEHNQEFNKYKDDVSGNEPLDIEVGCLAALRLRQRNWPQMRRQLEEQMMPEEDRPKEVLIAQPAGYDGWALGGMSL